jgi:hypothetical protein
MPYVRQRAAFPSRSLDRAPAAEEKMTIHKEVTGVDTRGVVAQNTPLTLAEGFPSGQRDQTVNLTAQPSEVRILPPPPDRIISGRGGGPASPFALWRVFSPGGCSSMVEPQPSKLMMWVRFPSPAPIIGDIRRHLRAAETGCPAHIAQSVEHFLGKEEVTGSNPVMGSIFLAGGRSIRRQVACGPGGVVSPGASNPAYRILNHRLN